MSQNLEFRPVGSLDDFIEKRPFQLRPFFDESKLSAILDECERANADYNELLFSQLRKYNPNVDVLLLDDAGKVVGAWSTMVGYGQAEIPPTLDDLGRLITQEERRYYMATSAKSTFIFYLREHEPLLQELYHFESSPHNVPGLPAIISRAALMSIKSGEKNPLGPAALKSQGIVLGRLGYWENSERNPEQSIGFKAEKNEKFGDTVSYIPRAIIDDHPEGKIHFTPLSPLDEMKLGRKFKRSEEMRRIVTKGPTGDFITNIFLAYGATSEVGSYPLVLRHNTLTPWKV